MKKIFFPILLILFSSAFAFSSYTGFKKLKKGDWSSYILVSDDGRENRVNYVYGGERKVDGKAVRIMELSGNMDGKKIVIQLWFDKYGKPVKYITRMSNGQLVCMTQPAIPEEYYKQFTPKDKTPEEFKPEKPDIRYGTYKLSDGRKIPVAIFKTESGETYVSGKVPFGIVKQISKGKVVLYLTDFGVGKKLEIPFDKAKMCRPFTMPSFPGVITPPISIP
ncbi:hypothetical protein [Desulfurobacterium atlanticum]|uniref:DUF3108 domain-containing protein n=1 Tax=Desulfurobacterium atlanticum TaxID=240169 RepID=A0A238XSJ1_9BACT|nr:hypothetical protein [Desulfurobacterium atlanticum]SNR61294.1 hypothetical protein SAMN06265340_101186 [Desulfurobacterium atlanticum]